MVPHPGHVGIIFQAFNGVYLGRATPRTLHLLPDGTVLSDRAIQKIRKGERGWRYAAAQLEDLGVNANYVRHPASGGAKLFRQQIAVLVQRLRD